jgi:hypothetical protein
MLISNRGFAIRNSQELGGKYFVCRRDSGISALPIAVEAVGGEKLITRNARERRARRVLPKRFVPFRVATDWVEASLEVTR